MDDFSQFQSISIGVNGLGQVENLTKALDAEAKAADRAEAATAKVSKAKQQMARDANQAAQALQDFAQGGIGGVLNNLDALSRLASKAMPTVTAFFGGPAGLAAAATVTGIAIWSLQEPVKALVGWMTSEGNGIPKATDVVGKLDARLGEVKERLGEMKKAWDESSASVAEYNRLTAEQASLEKELTAAKKERAAIDAQRDKESGLDRASGAAVSDAVTKAGGVDKVAADLAGAMPGATGAAQAQLDQLNRERDAARKSAGSAVGAQAGVDRRFAPQIAAAEDAVRQARADAQAGASGIVGRALQGDQGAVQQLERGLPGRGFGMATKDGLKAKAEAEDQIKEAMKDFAGWFKQTKTAADKEAKTLGAMNRFDEGRRLSADDREARVLDGQRRAAQAESAKAMGALNRQQDDDQYKAAAEEYDRLTGGGFSGDERDAVDSGFDTVRRAGRGQASAGEIDKALSEAERALTLQTTAADYDPKVVSTLSALASQLTQLKMQMNSRGGQTMQGPAMGNFAPEPFGGW